MNRRIAASSILILLSVSACSSQPLDQQAFDSTVHISKQTAPGNGVTSHSALMSAGALAFGRDDVLFVGDSIAGKVHAFELTDTQLDDQSGYQLGRAQTFEGRTIIERLDREIADVLRTHADEISINDMVIHQSSMQVFISAHKGHGPNPDAFILKVNDGKVEVVHLDSVRHTAQSVGLVPNTGTFEFGQSQRRLAVTDIDYFNGEIFVAGISNEEFSSKLRRMTYPFNNQVGVSSIEIWHAVHAQYETRAPIITQTIAELDGEPTLIAIYACTPIVRLPLSELVDGAKVRGQMIGEMGFGNTPIDIVSYVNMMDKSDNVIVTNTNRSAAQIPLQAIAGADEMPHGEGVGPVFSVSGVLQYPMPMSGTQHLDILGDQWAITIRQSPEDSRNIQLHTLPLPFFFDRADHIVEMNWADGPDPFGYKSAPPVEYD
ncbi:MAG: hypothetical protein AAF438_10670 [Pseudomonadota bacterium]